jgi:hypothetical protein
MERLTAGQLKKILERIPDSADVVLRQKGIDVFVKLAFAWVYDNNCEALVLMENNTCPTTPDV